MDENSKNFNKEKEGIKKYQLKVSELKGTIDELKNTLEGFSSKLDVRREWHNILKCWGGETSDQEYVAKLLFRIEGKIRVFQASKN